MKPETADYLAKARECLNAAIAVNTFPLPQVTAKEAYLAAFHAVHAYVFETTGKVVKSHGGMRTMFALLARDDPRIDPLFPSLPGRLDKFKEVAGYAARLEDAGQQALLNWVCLAGAMDAPGRKPDWADLAETCNFAAPKAFAAFNPPLAQTAE